MPKVILRLAAACIDSDADTSFSASARISSAVAMSSLVVITAAFGGGGGFLGCGGGGAEYMCDM